MRTSSHSQGTSAGKAIDKGQQGNVYSEFAQTINTTHVDADGMEEVEAWDCHPDCPCAMFPETTVNPPGKLSTADCGYNGGWKERIPFGYDVHGSAARFFYQAKAGKRERWFYCRDCQVAHCETERKDHGHGHLNEQGKQDWSHVAAHPTVKPVQLMQYLVRLVTPPNGLILDPFGGTGTTAAAAIQEGFKIILCEQDAEYAEIIKGRIGSSCQAELDDFPLFKESDKIEPQPKPKQQEMFQ